MEEERVVEEKEEAGGSGQGVGETGGGSQTDGGEEKAQYAGGGEVKEVQTAEVTKRLGRTGSRWSRGRRQTVREAQEAGGGR